MPKDTTAEDRAAELARQAEVRAAIDAFNAGTITAQAAARRATDARREAARKRGGRNA